MLGGRYRLVAPLGSGASASVYLGDDVTLRRRVAVKVLHPALADDEAFLRRFRAEAQVAAALNHPNVLAVHDWGQDGTTPYLVTEFLAGGSLRSMLDTNATLTPSQVLVVGLEAARGLAYAHRSGLVHRDIKPANLLFDDDARLRIADFGLARALAEASWTEPMGTMLGTARYASPEQARGETLDGRSDVYSLAVVLVEAATGTAPFGADTTLGTLMARVDAPVPVPDNLGPLGDALAAAGVAERDGRPDADQFAALLFDAARRMERPGPLPLATGLAAGPDDDTDVGAAAPAVTPPAVDATVLDVAAAAAPVAAIVATPETAPSDGTAPVAVVVNDGLPPQPAAVFATDDPPAPARRRRWPALVAVALVAAVVAGGVGWWASTRVATAEVPSLVGVAVAAAEQAADTNEWELVRTDEFHPVLAAGLVVSHDPAAGQPLDAGGVLTVVVSAGPAPVPLPDGVVGVPLADAEARLVEVGLALGVVTDRFDEQVPDGVVLGAEVEPGVELPFGEQVDLVVSAGPEPRTVPDNLIGRALNEVRNLLESLGLPVSVGREVFSDTVAAGSVVQAAPGPGQTVDRGTPVLVDVSLGPPVVAVPNVAGLAVVDAAARLEAAGLVVTATTGSPTRPVTGTSPQAGATVRIGSSITITTQ